MAKDTAPMTAEERWEELRRKTLFGPGDDFSKRAIELIEAAEQDAIERMWPTAMEEAAAGMEEAALAVRHNCSACEGKGYAEDPHGQGYECEYCGRPMAAIRARAADGAPVAEPEQS